MEECYSISLFANHRRKTVFSKSRSAPFLANKDTDMGLPLLPTGITACSRDLIAYLYCLPLRLLVRQSFNTSISLVAGQALALNLTMTIGDFSISMTDRLVGLLREVRTANDIVS